jgi:site-specific DNA-methyltransferase (cytosine-N4-specific)
MELNRVYNESCLETLARMPDAFLDCVVTSPPYYGLRSYGTEPQIWGNHNGCQHVWGEQLKNPKADLRTPEQKVAQGGTVGTNVATLHWSNGNLGNFCQSCNAWRGELGLEPTFQLYISHLIDIFREVKRVLKPTGTVFVNLGDSYSGSGKGIGSDHGKSVFSDIHIPKGTDKSIPAKSLMNIPHRFFIAMTDELGFIQRNNLVWHKPACMPSSAKDRFTVDFESIGFFTKSPKYWFEQQIEPLAESTINHYRTANELFTENRPERGYTGASQRGSGMLKPTIGRTAKGGDGSGELGSSVRFGHCEVGRNMRTVWTVNFEPSGEEHYASYPTRLIEIPIKAGCPPEGIVYDPFGGTATTAVVAHKLGRNWICSELQPKYAEIANKRLEPYLAQPSLI